MADSNARGPKRLSPGSTTTPPNKRFYAEMPDNEAWDQMTEAEQLAWAEQVADLIRGQLGITSESAWPTAS